MEVIAVQEDGSEQLLASDVDSRNAGELEEWWRYTKPFGPGVKIVVRSNLQAVAGWSTTGTEPRLPVAVGPCHSESYIG
jgi:hypothetical protein